MNQPTHWRFHLPHAQLGATFGTGSFGALAERIARFFGTPYYLIGQTFVVIVWIAANAALLAHFDPYPFILLNLAFSLQAAYAAPLILLAQTRQAERDRVWSDADARHRENLSESTLTLLQQNTELTQQVESLSRAIHHLTEEVHARVLGTADAERLH
jgi:uncharacterized membrane protein